MNNNIYNTPEFKENLKKYEAARQTGSSVYLEPDDLTDISEYYHLHGRLDDALEANRLALQMFPGATSPLVFRARVALLVDNDPQKAMAIADKISDKTDFDYYYILAEIWIAQGNIKEAEDYLEEKYHQISDEDDAEDFVLDVATLYADYDEFRMAKQWLNISTLDDNPDYKELEGRIAMGEGHYEKSERIFNKLLDNDPYSSDYWDQLASSQFLHRNLKGSIESSDFSLAIDPDNPDAIINKANGLAALGNLDEALNYYQRFCELQPHSELGEMGVASVFTAQRKFAEALKHLQKAETVAGFNNPNRLEILRQQCLVNAYLGHYEDAFANIDQMDQAHNHVDAENAVLRGYVYLMAQHRDMASQWFDFAITSAACDDVSRVKLLIAYSAYDSGYPEICYHFLHELLSGRERNRKAFQEAYIILALCDAIQGKTEEFLNDLHTCVTMMPEETFRSMADFFPKGMTINDFETYAREHTREIISNIQNNES